MMTDELPLRKSGHTLNHVPGISTDGAFPSLPSAFLPAFCLTNQTGRPYVHFADEEATLECWLHVSSSALPE